MKSKFPTGILAIILLFFSACNNPFLQKEKEKSHKSIIEMVWVPAGSFQMGSPGGESGRISPRENFRTENSGIVTLTRGFWMGKYQVTQEQWLAVMGTNPSYFHGGTGREPAIGEIQGKRPVEQVSWYETIIFCNRLSIKEGLSPAYKIDGVTNPDIWISTHGSPPTSWIPASRWNFVEIIPNSTGYRLPTEAQWEYACRAGTTTAYNNGATINDDTGWYSANSSSRTRQVGLKPANTWGLYDKHGNVWEWCWDWYVESYNSAGGNVDPRGAASGPLRVLRGGSWVNSASAIRSAYRFSGTPSLGDLSLGFRVLRP